MVVVDARGLAGWRSMPMTRPRSSMSVARSSRRALALLSPIRGRVP
jgi:hypothetical protein